MPEFADPHDKYCDYQRVVMKKELEFVLKMNNTWNSKRMYTFSSFKGEKLRKYHRITSNAFATTLILINSMQAKDSDLINSMTIHVFVVVLYTIYVTWSRPYRTQSSNVLQIVGMLGVCIQIIAIFVVTIKHKSDSENPS